MTLRILHVVEAAGIGGGVENGIANLIGRLDPERFDHCVCGVFGLGKQIERYPADRVRLLSLEQRRRRFSVQVRPIVRAIRKWQPDVVHSRNWGALEAVVAARWAGGCAVVHSEHGVEMIPSAEPWRRNCFRRLVFGLAHHVFAVSHQLRDALSRGTGFPTRRIGVIHNGVDGGRFRPDHGARQRVRMELAIAEEEFCIGCVGRLNRIKDYPTLLRAAELLSRSGRPWRVLIVGDGPEFEPLQAIVSASPVLNGRVMFLGASNRIPELLNGMDVYVLPSLCEGISNSLLEAMASGLPVIASAVGGNLEVVVDGESGLLFPVGDFRTLTEQLFMIESQANIRDRLRARAIRRVNEAFSLDSMVKRYEVLYNSLAMGRAGGRSGEEAFCGSES